MRNDKWFESGVWVYFAEKLNYHCRWFLRAKFHHNSLVHNSRIIVFDRRYSSTSSICLPLPLSLSPSFSQPPSPVSCIDSLPTTSLLCFTLHSISIFLSSTYYSIPLHSIYFACFQQQAISRQKNTLKHSHSVMILLRCLTNFSGAEWIYRVPCGNELSLWKYLLTLIYSSWNLDFACLKLYRHEIIIYQNYS